MRTSHSLQVVKVGGSLLSSPQSPWRLRRWLTTQTHHRNILIAGGGARVDAIRARYDEGHLTEAEAHWQAIASMAHTATLVQQWLDVPKLDQIEAIDNCRCPILVLDVNPWMHSQTDLPIGWSLTSDSIAAAAAARIGADALTLLKSCPPPAGTDSLYALSQTDYVDERFHHYAHSLANVFMIDLTTVAGDSCGSPNDIHSVF